MRKEFKRRRDTYGIKYVDNGSYGMADSQGSGISRPTDYRGPMTSWIRAVSNGITEKGGGFVLRGGDGFDSSYGINGSKSIIGYAHNGTPHVIDNVSVVVRQKHRPIPGIESIEVDIRKDVYRLAFIKWKCYSVEQLNYMMPYMFNPYTTVLLEWGWNNYNPHSLIDISKPGEPTEFDENGTKIKKPGSGMLGSYMNPGLIEDGLRISEGRYDGMIGHIVNFDFTFNPSEMCFNCTTEIASNSRFYFGLIADSTAAELEETRSRNNLSKATKLDFFSTTVPAFLNDYLSNFSVKGQSKAKAGHEDKNPYLELIKGRIFSPNYYLSTLNGSKTQSTGHIYVSFGLLVDILNKEFANPTNQINIKIENQKIGAHPNLVSCSDKFLIPNASAPYFNPSTLSDSVSPVYTDESVLYESSAGNENQTSDKLLKKILFTTKRQNLDKVINYLKVGVAETQFPSSANYYEGMLKNIYLSFDFLKEQISSTPDLRSFLKSICEMLNDNVPVWRLEVIDWENNISIRDINYLDAEILTQKKSSFGIDNGDPAIYMFDAFSQNSFFKEFGFNVKLSDPIANAVANQVNNQIVSDKKGEPESSTGNVTNRLYVFPVVNDILLKGMPPHKAGSTEGIPNTPLSTTVAAAHAATVKREAAELTNIDHATISFRKSIKVDGKPTTGVIRLVMPGESGKAKLKQLLDDDNVEFSNISTMPIPGVKVEFSILGISGFRMFQIFGVNNLPKPYDNVLFQITELKHSVTDAGWITRVTAAVRPRGSILTLI
jgi:hypothetical protein